MAAQKKVFVTAYFCLLGCLCVAFLARAERQGGGEKKEKKKECTSFFKARKDVALGPAAHCLLCLPLLFHTENGQKD